MRRIMTTTVSDHGEMASGEKDMSNKPSVTGLCACAVMEICIWVSMGGPERAPQRKLGFVFVFA